MSILPFPILYLISDGIYVLLYYVIGYRKKIVWENLRNAFPEKDETALRRIQKGFYRHLCDLVLESFKTLTIGKKAMLRHCALSEESKELFDRLANEGKSILLVLGHQGNWEWAGNTFSLLCKQQLYVIYHPLSNPYFDGFMYHMRTRFGTKLIAMKDTFREMIANKKELNATAFIADQTPHPEHAYWTQFLNQDTPVFRGTGKIAHKLNYPVVYVGIKKMKRGYYILESELLIEEPGKFTEDDISEKHTQRLEKDIQNQPEIWLWSHRRWKHKRK